jgi:hypothetical protein
MTVQLTTNIAQPNITRWRVLAFELNSGLVTIRIASGNEAQWVDLQCRLSDVANGSSGPAVNAAAVSWNDKIAIVGPGPAGIGGVGAANSLTNAQAAYRTGANHNAGLKAVELQALVDGWVSAALGGT